MKIVLNLELCAGHGQCTDAAPEIFALEDAGHVVQLIEDPDEKFRPAVEDAVRRCPESVIELVD